ncbi:MAG: glycoside hydrolase family 3 N-terminal domain-containing protein [Acidimicrobiales bacterium]|jgi:beta-N-acetylhexosaminidase
MGGLVALVLGAALATTLVSGAGARASNGSSTRATPGVGVAGLTKSMSTTTTTCTNETELAKWTNARLAMLTIAVPVAETSTTDATSEVTDGAGGVLLFGAAAPADLGADLSTLESHVPGHIGLLVMTDEEGGGVQRMANLVGSLHWASWMGHYWTAGHIESAVAAVGKKMAAANVNMDLAPVVDVDGTNAPPSATDPDGWRSFSGHTPIVVRDGIAFMNGLLSSHVIPVLKHFPGLGGVSGNTDDGPAHTLPWSELVKVALPPFTRAIKAGAPAIMVSNATVPGLALFPASLSPAAIGRELETTLGFHGLVLTDSLSAKAIPAAGFTLPEAAVQALLAGADMVLFGPTTGAGVTAAQTSQIESAIVSAVTDGHLMRSRLASAAAAVLAVRHVQLCH